MDLVDVLLPFGGASINHPLTYRLPGHLEGKISIGDPVTVPFRSLTASGYVVGFSKDPGIPVKEVISKHPRLVRLSPGTLDFSRWMANRYVSPWWDALRNFVFPLEADSRHETSPESPTGNLPLSLTNEQELAAEPVLKALREKIPRLFLLHGITGSGKTEIYLTCARSALDLEKEVLVLVPEIPLSFQVARRFRQMFGNLVVVLHSGLSEKEKRQEQSRFYYGKARIVIGPRMALFAPFKNLGLIIVDEEHDSSYKQEHNPRYHAITVAEKMAENHQAVLLLGSATPSLESHYATQAQKYSLLTLQSRYEFRSLPKVEIVDLRQKNYKTPKPFSLQLMEALNETVTGGHQAILFLNRRGFSPLMICTECGLAFHCPKCNISLTFHLERALLRCHYCNYQQPAPRTCPSCNGCGLTYRGFGTQRLEEEIRKHFPGSRVLRLDKDTASRRGATKEIVEAFTRKEAQILIGTQMVTKGFDFPSVNLVGILNADHLLHFPDFRAGEKTFQLLTQVAGRAGRGKIEGKVILQTYDPEHPVIQSAANHDYSSFYQEELESRKAAEYPPFVSLANILLTGEDEQQLEKQALSLQQFLSGALSGCPGPSLLGPSPCPIQKINKNYRWHLVMKSTDVESLSHLGKEIHSWFRKNGSKKIRLIVDVDPVHLL